MELEFDSNGTRVFLDIDEDETVLSVKAKVCKAFNLGTVNSFDLRKDGKVVEDDAAPDTYQPPSPVSHFRPITQANTSSTTSTSSVFTHVSSSSTQSTSISETPLANGDLVSIQCVSYPTQEVGIIDLLDECVVDGEGRNMEGDFDDFSDYTCDDMACEDYETCETAFTLSDKHSEVMVTARPGVTAALRVFSTSGSLLSLLEPAMQTVSLATTLQGQVFALSADGNIHAWNTESGEKRTPVMSCGVHVKRLQVSPCQNYLGAFGDNEAQIWCLKDPESPQLHLRVPCSGNLGVLAQLHGASCLFVQSTETKAFRIECWALSRGSLVKTFEIFNEAQMNGRSITSGVSLALSRAAMVGYSEDEEDVMGSRFDNSSYVIVGAGDVLTLFASSDCSIKGQIFTDVERFHEIIVSPCGRIVTTRQGEGYLFTYRVMEGTIALLHCRDTMVCSSVCATECGQYVLACRDDRLDVFGVTEFLPLRALTVSMHCSDPQYELCKITPLGKLAITIEEDKVFFFM